MALLILMEKLSNLNRMSEFTSVTCSPIFMQSQILGQLCDTPYCLWTVVDSVFLGGRLLAYPRTPMYVLCIVVLSSCENQV